MSVTARTVKCPLGVIGHHSEKTQRDEATCLTSQSSHLEGPRYLNSTAGSTALAPMEVTATQPRARASWPKEPVELCHLLAGWHGPSHVASPTLRFFICNMKTSNHT